MRQPGQRHGRGRQDQHQAAQHQRGRGRAQAHTAASAPRRYARPPGHPPTLAHGCDLTPQAFRKRYRSQQVHDFWLGSDPGMAREA